MHQNGKAWRLEWACLPRPGLRTWAAAKDVCLIVLAGTLAAPATLAVAQDAQFQIEAPAIPIPNGVEYGQIRRVTTPFENWTLICDENLKEMTKICNIDQSIVDQAGAMVFYWSLAAADNGKPMMILRTPAYAGRESAVTMTFGPDSKPFGVKPEGCDVKVCVSMVPVGPQLRKAISQEAPLQISYTFPPNGTVVLNAPLKGLSKALAAIK
jgi:invasion protein IalB